MKKIIAVLLSFLVLFSFGTACSTQKNTKKKIVCTAFAGYDWIKNLLDGHADDYDLIVLADGGADMHNYRPSVEDMVTIGESTLFVYVGGESESWVADVLKQVGKGGLQAFCMLDALGDMAIIEDHGHDDHDHEEGEDHDHEEHEHEADEHVWLSLKNATLLCEKLAERLIAIDSEFSFVSSGLEKYKAMLTELDGRYLEAVASAKYDTLVFGDRFPFKYMARDYGLKFSAAFDGCSAESEASFETIVLLAKVVDELGLPAVCKIEGSNNKIAETVKANTVSKNCEILTFNSMQSVTKKNIADGANYISIMQNNLQMLKKALGV